MKQGISKSKNRRIVMQWEVLKAELTRWRMAFCEQAGDANLTLTHENVCPSFALRVARSSTGHVDVNLLPFPESFHSESRPMPATRRLTEMPWKLAMVESCLDFLTPVRYIVERARKTSAVDDWNSFLGLLCGALDMQASYLLQERARENWTLPNWRANEIGHMPVIVWVKKLKPAADDWNWSQGDRNWSNWASSHEWQGGWR
ncbi:MAG: hypothetical protein GY772_15985 [bacterium]|nr:hypothetical protein [bacterium]